MLCWLAFSNISLIANMHGIEEGSYRLTTINEFKQDLPELELNLLLEQDVEDEFCIHGLSFAINKLLYTMKCVL